MAGGKIPLTLHLLSPAHRPIQITRDLPGFWRGSWAAVRADLRGRYPRHFWPEDPASAAPTSRARSRAGRETSNGIERAASRRASDVFPPVVLLP